VRMQLCVAIASLAVHVPSGQFGEGGVIGWLFTKLQQESSPHVAVTCMLELLVALPQVRRQDQNATTSLLPMHHAANPQLEQPAHCACGILARATLALDDDLQLPLDTVV
jgi:hypothetical protein